MQNQYFQNGFSKKSEVDEHFKRRLDVFERRCIRIIDHNGADKAQIDVVGSIIGSQNPAKSPHSGSYPLRVYGYKRVAALLPQAVEAIPQCSARFQVLAPCEPSEPLTGGTYDFRALKARTAPQLDREFENYVAVPRLSRVEGAVRLTLGVVGFGAHVDEEGAPPAKMRASKVPRTEPILDLHVQPNAVELAGVAAALWEATVLGDAGPFPNTKRESSEWKCSPAEARIDLEALLVYASLRIDRIWFGRGLGKAIVKGISRELVARAGNLDLGGRAPVQAGGILPTLAGLPADKSGRRCVLPTVLSL